MKKTLYILTLVAICLSACKSNVVVSEEENSTQELWPSEVDSLTMKQNEFSLNLFKQVISAEKGNVFFSPVSIGMACGLLADGAVGETQAEIMTALEMSDLSQQDLNDYFQALMKGYQPFIKSPKCVLSNAVWLNKGLKLQSSFKNDAQKYYDAYVRQLDLSNPKSANAVNRWAKKKTKGMIPEVCDPADFNEDLQLMLTNSVYFKDEWYSQFVLDYTFKDTFWVTPKRPVIVNMMMQEYAFPCAVLDSVKMVRLFFKDSEYCMDIILPEMGVSIEQVSAHLTAEKLAAWTDSLTMDNEVLLCLPRFAARFRHLFNEDMQKLGMQKAFLPGTELPGICGNDSLFVSSIKQNAFIRVNEYGAEAAAATCIDEYCFAIPTEVFVTRPFLFFIRDVQKGTILFAGKIVNPTIY